jgi:hypothetical protein
MTTIDPGTDHTTTQRDLGAVLGDGASIVVFVLLGRTSHNEGSAVTGTLATVWPFLAGGALGWVVILVARRLGAALPGRSTAAGGIVLLCAVVAGMALRRSLAGGGTPVSFVLVASSFLALFLLGWRWAARRWGQRRAAGAHPSAG